MWRKATWISWRPSSYSPIVITSGVSESSAHSSSVVLAESTREVSLQKRAESHLVSRGWRSWPWQLIILLCECLTSICISTEQAVIKRTVLFGTETSSENILAFATDSHVHRVAPKTAKTESTATNIQEDLVCLMQMVHYRAPRQPGTGRPNDDSDDQSWRIRYMGLLCLSQVYKHLANESRYKTLSNLLWTFVHEFEKFERDDRVLEALKVGRVRTPSG